MIFLALLLDLYWTSIRPVLGIDEASIGQVRLALNISSKEQARNDADGDRKI